LSPIIAPAKTSILPNTARTSYESSAGFSRVSNERAKKTRKKHDTGTGLRLPGARIHSDFRAGCRNSRFTAGFAACAEPPSALHCGGCPAAARNPLGAWALRAISALLVVDEVQGHRLLLAP
jgi:hypothetical protein